MRLPFDVTLEIIHCSSPGAATLVYHAQPEKSGRILFSHLESGSELLLGLIQKSLLQQSHSRLQMKFSLDPVEVR